MRARWSLRGWVVIGGLLLAIGSGLLWSAYRRNAGDGLPSPTPLDGNTILMDCSSIFTPCEEFDPALWYAAGTGLMLAAAGSLTVAVRLRVRA